MRRSALWLSAIVCLYVLCHPKHFCDGLIGLILTPLKHWSVIRLTTFSRILGPTFLENRMPAILNLIIMNSAQQKLLKFDSDLRERSALIAPIYRPIRCLFSVEIQNEIGSVQESGRRHLQDRRRREGRLDHARVSRPGRRETRLPRQRQRIRNQKRRNSVPRRTSEMNRHRRITLIYFK